MKRQLILMCLGVSIVFAIPSGRGEAATYPEEVLADNPIGYWRLNETSGTTAFDSSGNARDATYVGGVSLGASGALASGDDAAQFDGSTGYVQLPGTWGGVNTMTIEAWVNTNVVLPNDFQAIVSSAAIGEFAHFQLHENPSPSQVSLWYTDGGLRTLPAPEESPIGVWRHLVFVGESGDTRLYLDGVRLGSPNTLPFNSINLSSDVRIGAGVSGTRLFHGQIDEVAIYDTALSDERVLAHFNAAIPEPTTLMAMAIGGMSFLRRRRATLGKTFENLFDMETKI